MYTVGSDRALPQLKVEKHRSVCVLFRNYDRLT